MSNTENLLKIICLQENIKSGLAISERISSKNSSLPILANTLLKAEKGFLKISSTDLEIGVEILIPCKVEGNGSLIIPTKLVLNFINNLPNTKIYIEEQDGKLLISADNFKTSIPILNKDEFPIIPKIKDGSEVIINSQILKNAIGCVLNSVSLSDLKPEISGILFDFKKESLNIVATDGFRLSEKVILNKNIYQLDDNKSFILPQKSAQELVKIIDSNNDIKIIIGENQVAFLFDKINLISRIINGEYPNYKQIIPKTNKTRISLNKEEFVLKLKLASIFSSNINDIKFLINVDSGEFNIKSQDKIKGELNSSIDFDDLSGESVEVVFNWRYLLDGLSNINNDKVVFELNSHTSSALLKAKDDDHYLYIIMPIKQ
ncbi:MAG: DNA polymerase III subunit beta [Patescibacteria group bacterium]